jgi:adenylate cyclase
VNLPEAASERGSQRLPRWVERALDIAVVAGDNRETMRAKRLLTGALWISIPTAMLSILQVTLVQGAPRAGMVIGISIATSSLVLLVMWRRPSSFPTVMHFVALANVSVSVGLTVLLGGLLASGITPVWGMLSVLGAIVVFADRRAIYWLGFFVLATVAGTVIARQSHPILDTGRSEWAGLFNLMTVVVFVFFVLYYYVRQRARLLAESDALLRNVLPDEIADRLKSSDATIAERFESASVLFADVADFTPMSTEMSPVAMVALLDEVFTEFDRLVEERGLEKIKTIGDAYMVAAGVPHPRDDHAQAICDLALAMMELVDAGEFQGRRLSFRIGINSGEVVAGIIGTRKFAYDLWGDAVNTASRMEAFGVPGKIQLTQATCELVSDEFVCERRGVIEVKGKGPMTAWFLVGRKA